MGKEVQEDWKPKKKRKYMCAFCRHYYAVDAFYGYCRLLNRFRRWDEVCPYFEHYLQSNIEKSGKQRDQIWLSHQGGVQEWRSTYRTTEKTSQSS